MNKAESLMVNINELLQELEEQQRQEKRKKIKEWLKMRLEDLKRLMKMLKNSGIEDIKISELKKILNF